MRTSCLCVMIALLVVPHHAKDFEAAKTDMGDEQHAWVNEGNHLWPDADPNQQCIDAHVNSLSLGGEALRGRVESCSRSQAFGMPPIARELFLRHIPKRFDQFNERPRGCVEIDMHVDEVRSGKVHKSWQVIVDVDNKTATQNAHYGYTIAGLVPRVPKATGHIFFPPNVFPPNVRPWLGEKKGQIVHFADHKDGPTSNVVFKLSGKMYNQFHTRHAQDEDVDDTDISTDGGGDDISLRTYII